MSYEILVIEDDSQIREVIDDYFTDKSDGNISIICASDGNTGLEMLNAKEYDLVMLDVMLPNIDGFTLCREIRKNSIVPILFITARGRTEDILYGYEIGCDDYIVKPFLLCELFAKTVAIIKRAKGTVVKKELICGKIQMDLITHRVMASDKIIELLPKEFAILKYLMEHTNWVVDRETLLNKIWGYDYFGSDRAVDTHIKKLRKALGNAGKQIKTVVTKGYKLTD